MDQGRQDFEREGGLIVLRHQHRRTRNRRHIRTRSPATKDEWPEFLFDRPEYRYPQVNCVTELLDRHIEAGSGTKPAITTLIDGRPVSCTYAQLHAQVNRIARVLTEDLQLVPGNRVLLRAPNTPMLAACWLAVVKAGLIAVGTMPCCERASSSR